MRNPVTLLALAAMLTPAVAQAAEDFRFGGDTGHRRFVTQSGIGAQASVAIKLDNMRVVRDRDRVRISLSAGPALSTQERSVTTGRALGININPGYTTTVTLAGTPVARFNAKLGAAEDANEKAENKGKKGPSTLGWVGIGVGTVVAVLGVATLVVLNTCNDSWGQACTD
jgi:hypothetical protein